MCDVPFTEVLCIWSGYGEMGENAERAERLAKREQETDGSRTRTAQGDGVG